MNRDAAFGAAGTADELDLLVRRIAEAEPVVTTRQVSGGRSAEEEFENTVSSGGGRGAAAR